MPRLGGGTCPVHMAPLHWTNVARSRTRFREVRRRPTSKPLRKEAPEPLANLYFEPVPLKPGQTRHPLDTIVLPTEETILQIRDMLMHEHRDSKDPIPPGTFQPGVLSGAIERARWGMFPPGVEVDLFLRTAFLIRGITGEHAFANGCKRTGLMVAGVTLFLNGYKLEAGQGEAAQFMMDIADRRITDPTEMAAWLRRKAKKTHPSLWAMAMKRLKRKKR